MKIIDAQSLAVSTLYTDICIVGTGPAGQALAREFAGTQFRVCMIESGGFKKRRDTQRLNNAEAEGTPYQNPRHTRSRQLGGTSNRWEIKIGPNVEGGRFAAYDPLDFEDRYWLPEGCWPFDHATIEPYYHRAQKTIHLGPFEYMAEYWETPETARLALNPEVLTSGMYQFGARANFEVSKLTQNNLTILYNATVQEVETHADGGTVTGIRALTYNGKTIRVNAEKVVLAMGGIETVRLLLLSTGRNKHPGGLGNDYDQLGRYFMDHPQAHFGVITPKSRDIFEQVDLYDLHWQPEGGYATMGMLKLSEAAQRREKLPNFAFLLYPRRRTHLTKTYQAYRHYTQALHQHYIPPSPVENFTEMLRNAATTIQFAEGSLRRSNYYYNLAEGGWSDLPNKSKLFEVFEVITQIEQLPHPENRISLGTSVDAYNQRRAKIHWHWGDEDTEYVRCAHEVFAAEMERAGIGETRFPDAPYHVPGSHHHIGGARINVDPHEGVVDENLKVHGVDGLYLSTSATFPTGSYANPTLTIVALAIRLADHLKQAEKRHAELWSSS